MKIYTKTGDKGKTSLLGGTRVSKSNERINAYGTIDEFNSFLGLVCDQEVDQDRAAFLREIQARLFTIGSSLAAENEMAKSFKPDLLEDDVTLLEKAIDSMNAMIPPLKNFVIPGGHPLVSSTHVARTVCRRAERLIIELSESAEVEEIVIRYLNRLSDYLFTLARMQAKDLEIEEIPWKPRA